MKTGLISLSAVALAGFITLGVAGERGQPAKDGIRNFGKVSEIIYRGAEPDQLTFEAFKRLGIKSIVDLRMPGTGPNSEAAQAVAGGILYTNIPFHGTGRPTDEQIRTVLSLFETLPGPVFVHCKHGCDRTGTIIACYRIQHDKWSNESALKEAETFGLSRFERGMRKYVSAFALPSSPKLAVQAAVETR